VDIQPVMDKAWAVRAGLGWMGKHTNVITRDYGSWVFIGELLLNLELEYEEDQPADQCGSCTLCLDACPTGAIVEPYVVDANLCISHATIESRAPRFVLMWLSAWTAGFTAVTCVRTCVPGTTQRLYQVNRALNLAKEMLMHR